MAGESSLIFELSQIAMDLDMSGLMIETHQSPKEALSDGSSTNITKRIKRYFK